MTTHVKVGADEWLVADAGNTRLMTDGLSGCVAIGLVKGDKIALAHVYSDCSEKNGNWGVYEEALNKAWETSGFGGADKANAFLVYSDPSDRWLAGKIEGWLEHKGFEPESAMAPGCSIGRSDGVLDFSLKSERNKLEYLHGYRTSADAGDTVQRATLSKSAAPAQAATVLADRDERKQASGSGPETDLRLSEAKHPMHEVYNQILAKIPKELVNCEEDDDKPFASEARQLASALTVEYMKHGGHAAIGKIGVGGSETNQMVFLATDPPEASGHGMSVELAKADSERYPQLERQMGREAMALYPDYSAQTVSSRGQNLAQSSTAPVHQ
ncbi:hypothetical protein [Lysobacter sp. CA196]|uniref:hypothetical protein n=1 Tax=Lysobacter sp. CA196 TaxID=3455606 RepID=UPI003F8D470A